MTLATQAARITTRHDLETAYNANGKNPVLLAETWNRYRLMATFENGRMCFGIFSYRGTEDIWMPVKEWHADIVSFAYRELDKVAGITTKR